MNRIQINERQFTILVIVFCIGSTVLFIPSVLAAKSKQDAWIASGLSVGAGVLLAWFYAKVGRSMSGNAPVQACEKVMGPWLGKLAGLWYIFFSLLLASLVLRSLGDFIVTAILPETPIEMILLLFMSVVVLAVRSGPVTIARTAETFFPWIILFMIVLTVLLLPKVELQKVLPLGEAGIGGLAGGMFPFVGTPFLDMIVLLSVYRYVPTGSSRSGGFIVGTLISGLMLTLVVFLSITVLGPDLTAKQNYPSYVLARKISLGHFLERMESIMAGLWFLTVYFKTVLCCYAATVGLAQLFRLSDYKVITVPLGIIVLILSIIVSPDTSYLTHILHYVWTPYAFTAGLLLPAALWIASSLRGK